MVPRHIAHRIYGDSLAIAVNVRTRTTALLRGEALRCLGRAADAGCEDDLPWDSPSLPRLIDLGVVEAHGRQATAGGAPADATTVSKADLSVVNLWAFKNHIPLSGHLELTGRCNVRCRHCYCVFDRAPDTLGTEQVTRILDDLASCGALGLVLTGGELFVRKDALEILRHLERRRFIVRLNTNGTLIDERLAGEIGELGNIHRIHVSLHGSTAAVHDGITGVAGSFDKATRAIRLLASAGARLRINCCVMQTNIDDFEAVEREIAAPLGIPVRFDSAIFPRDDGETVNTRESLTPEQEAVFARFRRSRGDAEGAGAGGPGKPKLCKAAFSFFSVSEDGSVYPCLKMKRYYAHPMGNLLRQSFRHIWWGSPIVEAIREPTREKLRRCGLCDLAI